MPHSVVDDLLYEARLYAARFGQPHSVVPDKHLAIVTCMDSRIDVFGLFGLAIGDAHIIRNAGGIVTDDVLRSLVLSQRVLETREIILVHHTECGLQQIHEEEFREKLRAEVGVPPPYAFGAFEDVDLAVHHAIERVRSHEFLPSRELVHGFVYDVHTGTLREPR
ncbi:MAG: carbonic anhydrase [Candidatus Eremiobacteraeota bacterium]|nr:carbonic anhydrase [Candidatus Eremiobacteraeota bacterium]